PGLLQGGTRRPGSAVAGRRSLGRSPGPGRADRTLPGADRRAAAAAAPLPVRGAGPGPGSRPWLPPLGPARVPGDVPEGRHRRLVRRPARRERPPRNAAGPDRPDVAAAVRLRGLSRPRGPCPGAGPGRPNRRLAGRPGRVVDRPPAL